ncbi:MAG: uroporphyrinogen-III C-methyltransferase [Methylobacteriaceae bacterium]|nr:uroporphyrinogen-III C-methyltransferase [Methylobacteriaceae bacterium]
MTETPQRNSRTDAPAGAIQPLASLPVFYKLAGRRAIVAGGSDGAGWKAELLASTAAQVEVYAPDPCERLERSAAAGAVVLHRRAWSPADFAGARIAIADVADDMEAQAFRDAAHAAGVAVNIVDRPAFCDFQFGSIVNRSPLVVGISTDGAAPVFGQALRARIETLAPAGFTAWAKAARAWREDVAALDLPFRARRKFWEMFAIRAFERASVPPTDDDRRELIAAAASDEAVEAAGRGRVVLVGAGPGDPELLTLKAVRALQSADVVLFDELVAPAILDMARREAERIDVGKRGYKPSRKQAEITALLVELAGQGRTIVRLKGGDPSIFGRATEEIEALEAAGVDVEIVPGVTAASGAAAALRASLTERDLARRVQFVTAHGRDGRLPEDLDWAALADPKATTAVYMGVRTMPALVDKLLEFGLPANTPAIVIERATCPDERIIAATLDSICEQTAKATPSGPCLLLFGAALSSAAERRRD